MSTAALKEDRKSRGIVRKVLSHCTAMRASVILARQVLYREASRILAHIDIIRAKSRAAKDTLQGAQGGRALLREVCVSRYLLDRTSHTRLV